jgi:hypothetical protein
MLVVAGCGTKGVLASGGADSFIAHAVSPRPDGNFSLRGLFSPTTTFGPHVSYDPVKEKFVVIFRVNALDPTRPYCAGNSTGSDPLPKDGHFVSNPYIGASKLKPDPTGETGQNFFVAWADRMNGPWEVQKVEITANSAQQVLTGANVHISNNALFFFKNRIKGRVGMAFRYTHGNGYAVADNFTGPYTAISNLSLAEPPRSEDPVLFSTTSPDPSALHMIWHSGPHGYHAWSADEGETWAGNGQKGVWAYEANITLSNGSTAHFNRRERPALVFATDSAGGGGVPSDGELPAYLITAVQVAGADGDGPHAADGTAFPIIQQLSMHTY